MCCSQKTENVPLSYSSLFPSASIRFLPLQSHPDLSFSILLFPPFPPLISFSPSSSFPPLDSFLASWPLSSVSLLLSPSSFPPFYSLSTVSSFSCYRFPAALKCLTTMPLTVLMSPLETTPKYIFPLLSGVYLLLSLWRSGVLYRTIWDEMAERVLRNG